MKTAVLLIGFGGPRDLEEVRPFLASVTEGTRIPEARIREVYHHYEAIGGRSLFNEVTERQQRALQEKLRVLGSALTVGVAYRHSTPGFESAFEQLKRYGVQQVIAFILASFNSYASRQKYIDKLIEAREQAGAAGIRIVYTDPFVSEEGYLKAQAARIDEVWRGWSSEERARTALIFTAHSIPATMCEKSCGMNGPECYGYQFSRASRAVADLLRHPHRAVCYQSRSGNPRDPWLEPDVNEKIRSFAGSGIDRMLLVPIGFLCDNVEVVYDLDHEAKAVCEEAGLLYFRAGTVADHPFFIDMMARQILSVA